MERKSLMTLPPELRDKIIEFVVAGDEYDDEAVKASLPQQLQDDAGPSPRNRFLQWLTKRHPVSTASRQLLGESLRAFLRTNLIVTQDFRWLRASAQGSSLLVVNVHDVDWPMPLNVGFVTKYESTLGGTDLSRCSREVVYNMMTTIEALMDFTLEYRAARPGFPARTIPDSTRLRARYPFPTFRRMTPETFSDLSQEDQADTPTFTYSVTIDIIWGDLPRSHAFMAKQGDQLFQRMEKEVSTQSVLIGRVIGDARHSYLTRLARRDGISADWISLIFSCHPVLVRFLQKWWEFGKGYDLHKDVEYYAKIRQRYLACVLAVEHSDDIEQYLAALSLAIDRFPTHYDFGQMSFS